MPAPRLSQTADAARSAVEQAQFNEKTWVWVPDAHEGYLAGWVNKEDHEEEIAEVIMHQSGEFRQVPFEELFKMNPPQFDRVEDIADLTFLNEASVVHNLRLRYLSTAIYTYSGLFLVAINPYQHLPLYSDAIIAQYRGKRRDENPPHVFAVAERAWVNMGTERENQSILITGESGAGKTESTKKVIQYLAAIAADVHQSPVPSHSSMPSLTRKRSIIRKGQTPAGTRLGLLERQILQANPILESFGNAQTQRNNNSSRFGKFVRIMFSPDGSIAGANIDWYLLEKSRVVFRSPSERSFHVFYQLLAGGGQLKDALLLDGEAEDYEFLNKSKREVDGIDDVEEWHSLKAALDVVGFDATEQFNLFRIVAAILHIGNITVTGTRSDDAVMPDAAQAERVCHLLGIPIAEFTRAILRPRALAGREWVTQARTRQQAVDELSALSKTLYEKSFGSLVERINRALDRPSSKATFIGVLDIAGFEIFEINGYEQLLINYTNEKLQQFFNHHMFVLEQEEYAREGIQWDYQNFGLDLQPTIDLIEASGNTIGILSCLDEECIMPKADDLTFTNKLNAMWAGPGSEDDEPQQLGRTKYEPSRFEQGFTIQHYAAKVEYRTDGWLEKNKDPLNDNLTRVLAASSERYVASLFAEYADGSAGGTGGVAAMGRKRIKKGAFRTVAQRHKEQLSSLMAQLRATQPHFVRCIVPNNLKKPNRMDVPLVLDQLRCNGVLEGIRIARRGYPNRMPFVEFRQRYEILTPGILPKGYMDGREACRRMVSALELDDSICKLGTSKIFFKATILAGLEERRDALLNDLFTRLQAGARMWTARRQIKKILNRANAVRTIQRNARVYGELREWPWWQLYTKVRPLLAATRNDEELRRKELELALAKERAERDKQERDALEKLKMELEADKRRVEENLQAERALAIDKGALLERSKIRESELQEEIAALQLDVETLESQLTRSMDLQKESEEKHRALRAAFEEASDHLVRLEQGEKTATLREQELSEDLARAQEEIEALRGDLDSFEDVTKELKNLALQREEDLNRTKERMKTSVDELSGKLEVETRTRELLKDKHEQLENDARQAKAQLTELGRTTTDYSNMIKKKDEQISLLTEQLDALKLERDNASMEISQLHADLDTLDNQLTQEKQEHEADNDARRKLQTERDELRKLLATKTSEETRRSEVERSKEAELISLRTQCTKLQQELTDSRRSAVEIQNKLKVDLEQITREHTNLQSSHSSLSERERIAQAQLTRVQGHLAELERAKRSMDSELLSLRARQHDSESQLAEAQRDKTVLQRDLTNALEKRSSLEDSQLQLEREKEVNTRALETANRQLETETAKRIQLEKSASSRKAEIATLKERNTALDKELNKTLTALKALEWENKQLLSKQDKTIVEHVHVLEEAKRVTDRQLAEAQIELSKQQTYIQSLNKAKSKMSSETEDLTRKFELELRMKEQEIKAQEKRTAEALTLFEKERRCKEDAELKILRVRNELQQTEQQAEELATQLDDVTLAKQALENELETLANEADGGESSLAQLQRQYEVKISSLEQQLKESEIARSMQMSIHEQMERHQTELRNLVSTSSTMDPSLNSKLLAELQRIGDTVQKNLSRPRNARHSSSTNDIRPLSNHNTPTKKALNAAKNSYSESSERQVAALKQQVSLLEIQMAASERVRRHLQASVHDLTARLDSSDGSVQFLKQYKAQLAQENIRLAELLKEEAEARRVAQAEQIDGVQAMWSKFQKTIAEERENHTRLEESRRALVVQQRAAQDEITSQRNQLQDLSQSKQRLQKEVNDLKEQLDLVSADATDAKRELHSLIRKEESITSSSAAAHSELRTVIENLHANEQILQARYETAEMERAKAVSTGQKATRALGEIEKTLAKSTEDFKKALKASERRVKELEKMLQKEDRETSELGHLKQRLLEELEDERKTHQQQLEGLNFTMDQTRNKYQAELGQLSEELQAQRDALSRSREDNRKLRSDYDALQLKYDDEVYSSSGWHKEKERLEAKIVDVERAFEASTGAQVEQQSQIVALHSQVRELRGVLDEAEADRALLQKARRALQAELETIKLDPVESSSKLSSDSEFQRLQLKKLDLERALEEQDDRVASANERLRNTENLLTERQIELGEVRVQNSELDRLNASLEKQVKELKLRIVDLETKSYAKTPRPVSGSRKMDSRIEELTTQLQQGSKDRRASGRHPRMSDIHEPLRDNAKVESYEAQIKNMRQSIDSMQMEESNLQAAKRRAEREAVDYKQRVLSLEREVEVLQGRLDRPTAMAVERSYTGTAGIPRRR
ncbi:hypothetical protein D9619_010457 [Psilocybe cf. subviscida]|uniref:Nonmuscle myosin heavy chain b n=1 Tax=Psilocybe cf. subviscida TaxID=2480587 RepID=A0A8H5ES02_9AGAR|nr:hypothetical protein D9619_010457 [Psilocybe cf. subviscida]